MKIVFFQSFYKKKYKSPEAELRWNDIVNFFYKKKLLHWKY